MSDKNILGDTLVVELHMDMAVAACEAAKEFIKKGETGKTKHEIDKVLLELQEARMLFKKITK